MNPDFKDMLSALSEEGVEFLVVGAYALAAHGIPRATGALDIWVRSSESNAERLLGLAPLWRAARRPHAERPHGSRDCLSDRSRAQPDRPADLDRRGRL